jgi:hypothetical protein
MPDPLARLPLLLAALAAASGCALGKQTVRLTWPPPGEALAPEPPPPAPTVSLQHFDDVRPGRRNVVGDRGGLVHPELETPDDVAAWATAALRDELQRAGVRVVAPGSDVPVVGGEVGRVYAWGRGSLFSGEVRLRAWMRSGEAVLYDAHVRGEGKAGSMFSFKLEWPDARKLSGKALADAVRAASSTAAIAVAAAAGKSPPGGAAPSPEPTGAAVAAPPAPEEPPLRARSGWYLGFGLGWSFADVDPAAGGTASGGGSGTEEEEGQVLMAYLLPTALRIELGLPVGRRVLLGAEGNVNYPWYTFEERDLLVSQVLATATFYPLERGALAPGEREVAPRGWFLRGGVGSAWLRSKPYPEEAPPGSASWAASGWALSAGTGVANWFGSTQTRTVVLRADLGWQFFGSSAAEQPTDAFTLAVTVGFSLF